MKSKKTDFKRYIKSIIKGKYAFFDFDYTLAETYEKVNLQSCIDPNYFYQVDNKHFTLNRHKYEDEVFPLSFKEFDRINLNKCKPISETIAFMELLYNRGFKIVILSARSKEVSKDLESFIKKNSTISDYKFIGLDCGKSKSKLDVINSMATKGSYLVEDSIYNIAYISINTKLDLEYVCVKSDSTGYKLDFISQSKIISCIEDLDKL